MAKADKKPAKKASDLFHNIMKASVTDKASNVLYVFDCINNDRLYGYTFDKTGANLPINENYEGWKLFSANGYPVGSDDNIKFKEIVDKVRKHHFFIGNVIAWHNFPPPIQMIK